MKRIILASNNLKKIKEIKEIHRLRIKEYLNYHKDAEYKESTGSIPPLYTIKADIVLPCATQNDINLECAKIIVNNGAIAIGEGANMPTTKDATEYFQQHNVLFAPAKAANAGGVGVSALEMSQDSMRYSWNFEEVDGKLKQFMTNIFNQIQRASKEYNLGNNYVAGANIAAFEKISKAMIAQGII